MSAAISTSERVAPTVACDDRFLVVDLGAPHDVSSWAVHRGGRTRARRIAWVRVQDRELRPPTDPRRFLQKVLAARGLDDAVGLLTSRALPPFGSAIEEEGAVRSFCLATVGLGNALRVGDPTGPTARIGTINLVCAVNVGLDENALSEAMSIATEARTLAVLEAQVPSRRTGLPATGTGTDCIVVAARVEARKRPYAGKHTDVGAAIGRSVARAVRDAAATWRRERRGDGA